MKTITPITMISQCITVQKWFRIVFMKSTIWETIMKITILIIMILQCNMDLHTIHQAMPLQ